MGKQAGLHLIQCIEPSAALVQVHPLVPFAPFFKPSVHKAPEVVQIEAAPDEWDRLFNVDFFIKIGEKYIGLQIKPVNSGIQLPEIFKEYAIQAETHIKFTEVFGGKVFYLFSAKIGEKKEIQNKEVIDEIIQEIKRLS